MKRSAIIIEQFNEQPIALIELKTHRKNRMSHQRLDEDGLDYYEPIKPGSTWV